MRKVTADEVWLEDDPATGRLNVGITQEGNDKVGGIAFVEVDRGMLVVESLKKVFELELPVEGELKSTGATVPADWDAGIVFAYYEPGWKLKE